MHLLLSILTWLYLVMGLSAQNVCDQQPPGIENGYFAVLTSLPDITIYRVYCNQNYQLIGEEIAYCTTATGWKLPSSKCRSSPRCTGEPLIPNGYLTSWPTTTAFIRHINCNQGFTLVGNGTVVCDETGQWSVPGTCEISPSCNMSETGIENGYIQVYSRASNIARVKCCRGYRLVGNNDTALCSGNTEWRWKVFAKCESTNWLVRKCGPPPNINFARFEPAAGCSEIYATRNIVCDADYDLIGPGAIQCKPSGTWSTGGKCQPKSRIQPVASLPERLELSPRETQQKCGDSSQQKKPSLALIEAIDSGDEKTFADELHYGTADPNTRDNNTWTALMAAAYFDRDKFVEDLIICGAAVDARTLVHGSTALMVAAKSGSLASLNILLTSGASIDAQNRYMATPLMYAAQNGNHEIVRQLVHGDADVLLRDTRGNSALHWAVAKNHSESVRILLDSGMDPDVYNNIKRTPLMTAAKEGFLEIFQLLLSRGADPEREDIDGETAYTLRQYKGKTDIDLAAGYHYKSQKVFNNV